MAANHTGFIVVRLAGETAQRAGGALDIPDLRTVAATVDARELGALLDEFGVNRTARLVSSVAPQKALEIERRAAASRPLKSRGSITSFWRIDASGVADPDELVRRLNALEHVEVAYRERAGRDPAVVADNDPLAVQQTYLDAAPHGIDARFIWKNLGSSGEGVRVVDLEQGWSFNHEDLPPLTFFPGVPTDVRHKSISHGTAVLGIIGARDNERGIVGIAPNLKALAVASHFRSAMGKGGHVADTIESVLEHLSAGDVLLIEWETDEALPAEADPAVRMEIEKATALDIVVVEAAGNGLTDLDTLPDFDTTAEELDTEAIIVAACDPQLDPVEQAHARWLNLDPEAPFVGGSNFGSRVDCHAQGDAVVTTTRLPTDSSIKYQDDFRGTSAAAAIIAGAAALLESAHTRIKGRPLKPAELRQLFRTIGTPQASSRPGHIGVMPDLKRIAMNLGLV